MIQKSESDILNIYKAKALSKTYVEGGNINVTKIKKENLAKIIDLHTSVDNEKIIE